MSFIPVTDPETQVVCQRARDVLKPASQGYINPSDAPALWKLCRELLLRKNHHTAQYTVARLSGIAKDVRHERRHLLAVADLYRRVVEYAHAVDGAATGGTVVTRQADHMLG